MAANGDLSEMVAALAARTTPTPTPLASEARRSLNQRDRTGERTNGENLTEAVANLARRGTVPTPTAQDARAAGTAGNWTKESGRNSGATLTDVAVRGLDVPSANDLPPSQREARSTGIGGHALNPQFVGWLQGLPPNWTRIATPKNSTLSETGSSSSRRKPHSKSSTPDSSQLAMFPKEPTDDR